MTRVKGGNVAKNRRRKVLKALKELGEGNKWDTYFFKNNIVEELADVMVLLRQFQAHYNIDAEQLGTIMYNKIQRTLKRMEKE